MGWLFLEKLVNFSVSFFATIALARLLGPGQFGFLSYGLSLVAIFSTAGHFGLSGLVVREFVKRPRSGIGIMGTAIALKSAGYGIGIIALLVYVVSLEERAVDAWLVLFALAASLLLRPFDVMDYWFQSRNDFRSGAVARAASLTIASVLRVALAVTGASLAWIALTYPIQAAIGVAVLLRFFRLKGDFRLSESRYSGQLSSEFVQQGSLLFVGAIFATIYLKIDQVMIRVMLGTADVGVFAVAAALSEAWYFVPVAIMSVLFPRLISRKQENPESYSVAMQWILDCLYMAALVVAVLVTAFSDTLINILYGDLYAGSAPVLAVHIWAGLFIFMRAAFSKWILIEGHLLFSVITQGMGALVNVLLNLILIPRYGILGAAYATLASYATASYFALAFHSGTRVMFKMMTKAILSPIRYPLLAAELLVRRMAK